MLAKLYYLHLSDGGGVSNLPLVASNSDTTRCQTLSPHLGALEKLFLVLWTHSHIASECWGSTASSWRSLLPESVIVCGRLGIPVAQLTEAHKTPLIPGLAIVCPQLCCRRSVRSAVKALQLLALPTSVSVLYYSVPYLSQVGNYAQPHFLLLVSQ